MNTPLNINTLNRTFENRIRLGLMSLLMVNDRMDFNTLKELLDATDGNLASHMAALEKCDYIKVSKQFIGKKPRTTYTITPEGRAAFNEHLSALEKLIRMKH